ncbi:hypothetical protein, partial [Escherichia coli]|uniref:hypothetical protein n=1 Tax=Escherichia coli TaxID=562 RepID=UPI00208DA48B
ADRNRSHWSTSKTPSYTKSVSWQHHPILEEFLHGTQEKLGIAEKLGRYGLGSAETHVKDFMIRHKKMLGLSDEDVAILKILKDKGL